MLGALGAMPSLFGGSGGGAQSQHQASTAASGPAQGGNVTAGPVRTNITTGARSGVPGWVVGVGVVAVLVVGAGAFVHLKKSGG